MFIPTHPRTRERGFSLIELLIVVAIIGIIAAIAIPNYLESQHSACAASAVQSLRDIHASEVSYRTSRDRYADLGTLAAGEYLKDPALRAATKSRYGFALNVDGANPERNYEATGTPALTTRWRHFFVNATGVIRSSKGGPADASSPPID